MEAAFFDLDKTVISRPSVMAFGRLFYKQGLIKRKVMAKGLWSQLLYVRVGASSERVDQAKRSVLAVTRGWDQSQVRRLVSASVADVIGPITFKDASSAIQEHRDAGRRVYLVSAAPAEIVEPLAEYLKLDAAISTQARIDGDGRYTGEIDSYAYGPEKAELIRELAVREAIDLEASWAYSDSATDLPMLEAVGHPVAVNPDRPLRRAAEGRGWKIVHFTTLIVEPRDALTAERAVAGRGITVRNASLASALAIAVAAVGGAMAWAVRRRGHVRPASVSFP